MTAAEQVTDRCVFHGEGPFWDSRAERLRFVDMLAGDIVTLLPTGTVTRRHVDDVAAVIREREAGGYVVATERAVQLLDENWVLEETIGVFADTAVRLNEGGCGPDGRLYVGSMGYGGGEGAGALYRLDRDRAVSTVFPSMTIPNGLQWSADGATVFHCDTADNRITAYDFDSSDGTLTDPRPFVQLAEDSAGSPDGFAIDDEGGLWVGMWGGKAVHRYDDRGELSEVVTVAASNVTSCAFAGEGSSQLYITTSLEGVDADSEPAAGALFTVTVGARGAVTHRFAG
ncbi:SMP-30/gluconolactonase/LRE family protein [Marisediminicola sp. LYQ134]|uniref:SMP-30/gluconolactonase/LRE family protein n=1 Tax=Marisediminicola sp. LYQ134 TaxID=3391061 RepID=UPI003983D6AB